MITTPAKLPIEVWNIGVDFAAQLSIGETVTAGAASVSAGSATPTFQSVSGSVVTITVTGGISGDRCLITVSVTTSTGETLAENLQIQIA